MLHCELLRHRATVTVRLLAACVLAGLGSLSVQGAQAGERGSGKAPLVARSVSRGLRLTLMAPDRAYPRFAVVRLTVRLRNVSHHAIALGAFCTRYNPFVQVLDGAGTIVYPPALHYPPISSGACGIGTNVVQPGGTRQKLVFAILRGRFLRVAVDTGA